MIVLKLNGQVIECDSNYPYRAMIETLLNYGVGAKKSWLRVTNGWSEDSLLCRDYASGTDADKVARKTAIAASTKLSFFGPLNLSLLSQGRYLPPGNRLSFQLKRTSAPFCLTSDAEHPADGCLVSITKARLYVTKVHANPALYRAQQEMIYQRRADVRIPINRVKMGSYVIPAGVTEYSVSLGENIQRPKKIITGLVRHEAKTGDYRYNPFNFDHSNLKTIEMTIDGVAVNKRNEMDFETNSYARTYIEMMSGSGKCSTDASNNITYEDFKNGRALFLFDNSSDGCGGGGSQDNGFNFVGAGTVRLNLTFARATAHTTSVVVYQEKDDMITVNPEKGVDTFAGTL